MINYIISKRKLKACFPPPPQGLSGLKSTQSIFVQQYTCTICYDKRKGMYNANSYRNSIKYILLDEQNETETRNVTFQTD